MKKEVAALESALAASVPKAVALRACDLSSIIVSALATDTFEDTMPIAEMLDKATKARGICEMAQGTTNIYESALARALREAAPPPSTSTAKGSEP